MLFKAPSNKSVYLLVKSQKIIFMLTVVVLLTGFSHSVEKSKFYDAIDSLCYPHDIFKSIFSVYKKKGVFSWTDYFTTKTSTLDGFVYRENSSFLFQRLERTAQDQPYSFVEALEFYKINFMNEDFKLGNNSPQTYLKNPEGRDFIVFMDGCSMFRSSKWYNKFYYNRENLNKLTAQSFSNSTEVLYNQEITSLGYQIGRGLLYLFQNNYHYLNVNPSEVFIRNTRGMNIYKLKQPLNIR